MRENAFLTPEKARELGLAFDKPKPMRCRWCGKELKPLGAEFLGRVVSWARTIQIYVLAAFSPIPLSLMALDETRQMGVDYLKNFAAVCLAGVIILVLLVSFPIVLGGLNAASAGVPVVDSIVGGLSYAL